MGVRPAVADATPSLAMPSTSSVEPLSFQPRRGQLAWCNISNVDLEQVQRDEDIDVLEAHLGDRCAESFSYTPPHPGASRQCMCVVCPCAVVWCLVVQGVRACCAALCAVCPMCVCISRPAELLM